MPKIELKIPACLAWMCIDWRMLTQIPTTRLRIERLKMPA
jgi:hypothetical protein